LCEREDFQVLPDWRATWYSRLWLNREVVRTDANQETGIVGNNTVCALEKGPFGIQLQSLNLADLNVTFSSSANSTTQPLASSTVGGMATATNTPVQANDAARIVVVNVDGFVTIVISFLAVVFSL
jgi:hypothetical protein